MSAIRYSSTNRLLPYRGRHTELECDEANYVYNNPTLTNPDDPSAGGWTAGSNATIDTGAEANWTSQLYSNTAPSSDANVYMEQTASNTDISIPCTHRVVVGTAQSTTRWVRIWDGSDTNTSCWVFLDGDDPDACVIGSVGSSVIDARLTYTLDSSSTYTTFIRVQVDVELPGGTTNIRVQIVDGDTATTVTSGSNVDIQIDSAEIVNGKVSSWVPTNDSTLTVSQSTAGAQPFARPIGVPDLNDQLVPYFGGDDFFVSDVVASNYGYLHQYAGRTIAVAHVPTGSAGVSYLLSTRSTGTGVRLYYSNTDQRYTITLEDTSSNSVINNTSGGIGEVLLDTLHVVVWRTEQGASVENELYSLPASDTTAPGTWVDGGNPQNALRIGVNGNDASGFFTGYICGVDLANVRWTDTERDRAIEHYETKFGCERSVPGCILSIRSDRGITLTTGEVSAIEDQSADEQTVAIDSSSIPYIAASRFGQLPSLYMTASDESISCSAIATALTGQVARSIITAARMRTVNSTGSACYLWQLWGDGGASFEGLSQANDIWYFQRKDSAGSTDTLSNSTAADTRPHVFSYTTDGSTVKTWIDGSSDINTSSNKSLTVSSYWFPPTSTLAEREFAAHAVYDVELDAYQRGLIERVLARRYFIGAVARPYAGYGTV